MAPGEPGDKPEYKVYRSRRGLRERLRPRDQASQARDEAQRRLRREEPQPDERRGPAAPPWRRIAKWAGIALGGWLLLSLALFMLSAQLEDGVSDETEAALSDGGSLATGSTILVLGSDERPEGSLEPGAGGPERADSIMLLHVGIGTVRRLSILRDSYAAIPGHGSQKINAAYAFGGPALTIDTVEQFLGNGLDVNHVVEVSFEDFPEFIDALGGIDVTLKRCVRSPPFSGRALRLSAGEHHLNGQRALQFARVRKNECVTAEDDRARAGRQQQVMSAIRSRILSLSTFLRLPLVSWQAPRTLRTDLKGPGLLALFADMLTGGSGKTRILKPSSGGPGGSLIVSEEEKARAVRELTGRSG